MDARSHDPGASAPPVLLPKHIIFLSHSGQEKAFVQELNQSLLRVNHSPFFDQNEDSLPTGERFPELIFEAAKQCRVAVIVLSPGYLKAKWPMLELVEFHQSIKDGNPIKLLPVFYKLKPNQIESPEWTEAWVELFKRDKKLVKKCKDAVHFLKAINGIIFEGQDHIKYKKDVVLKICNLWRPPLPFDTSDMQGCDRLCKHISELFKEHNGIYCLGIYGIHGSGKSKQCQAMCNYNVEEYAGKFCIVDLEDDKATENRSKKEREKMLKTVIKKLVDSNQMLDTISDEAQLREYFKGHMQNECVFLVVENVSRSSIKEAEFYVKARYAHGSRVLVTSRNRRFLEEVFGGRQYSHFCQSVPILNDVEAVQLVLAIGAPGKSITDLSDHEYGIVSDCCAKSCFDEQYHPSLLIARARYFERTVGGHEIANWNIGTSMLAHDVFHDVFHHDQLDYDKNLSRTAKLIFMERTTSSESKLYTYMDLHPGWQWDECTNFTNAVRYISYVRGLSFERVQREVKKLQEMSFLKESTTEVAVSDFYKTFARWFVKDGDREECNQPDKLPTGFLFIDELELLLNDTSVPYNFSPALSVKEFKKLVHLQLVRVRELQVLILQSLSSLRVLEVKECKDLKEIVYFQQWIIPNFRRSPDGCLEELRLVQLANLPNLEGISFAQNCTNMETFWAYECPKVRDLTVFRRVKSLKRLALSPRYADEILKEDAVTAVINNLTELVIRRGHRGDKKERIANHVLQTMMNSKNLEVLDIGDISEGEITDVKSINVSKLVSLTILDLSGIKMTIIEELCELWKLRALSLYGCSELLGLPDLNIFTSLKNLCISHCDKLVETLSKEDVPHRVENFHALGDGCNFDDHECLNPG